MKKQGIIKEYDVLRVIVTLLVVIGHCSYYHIVTPYGGCDYDPLAEHMSILYKGYRFLVVIIYAFHMPLFMALSGALYRVSSQNKERSFKNLLKNKFFRLIVPFWVVSVLYSIPIKYLSGYFAGSDHVLSDILIGQVLVQGNTHLWYLLALFFIFLVFYAIEPFAKSHMPIWLILALLLNYAGSFVKIQIVSYVMMYLLWFSVGYAFESKREAINQKMTIPCILLSGIGLVGIVEVQRKLSIEWLDPILGVLTAVLGSICIYALAYRIAQTTVPEKKAYQILSRNSFGCYLYSDPLNYPILWMCTTFWAEKVFSNNLYSLLSIGLRFVVSFVVSLLITELLRKCKAKYLY